jgi:hypothetical protein
MSCIVSSEIDKRCNMPAGSKFPKMSNITITSNGAAQLHLTLRKRHDPMNTNVDYSELIIETAPI